MNQPTSQGRFGGVVYVIAVLLFVIAVAVAAWWWSGRSGRGTDANAAFANSMATGQTLFERGDANKAIEAFQRALVLNPANPDVHLNLANAFLRAGQPSAAAGHAEEVLRYEPGSGAAFYVLGCAQLRQNQYSNAVQSLSQAKSVDPTENPVSFQLGRAYFGWGKFEDAAAQFQEVLQFETNHPSAHYLLSQTLLRLGQREAAQTALQEHQRINAGKVGGADDPTVFERSKYTAIRVPFSLEQPAANGIAVKFTDDSARAFGAAASQLRGPIGVLDINRRGWNDLLLVGKEGAQVFWNSNGVFTAYSPALPVTGQDQVRQILVGDLQNDRFDDAVLIAPAGVSVLRFATNGNFSDVTQFSGLKQAGAAGNVGALADLDFTGKLGLLLASPEGVLRSFTNLGSGVFRERKPAPAQPDPLAVSGVTQITVDDLNNDDLPDVLLTRSNLPPFVLYNVRGGGLSSSNQPAGWPIARAAATGDFNNDLRVDVALVTDDAVELCFSTLREPQRLPARHNQIEHLRALDYDNDGWLDLVAWGGDGIRVWRNRGSAGFHEMTEALGLSNFQSRISDLVAADFDQDGDVDLIASVAAGGLRFLRNDGGNANELLKLRLLGNRSNFSALGVKIELASGGWHTIRTVQQLPVEIGVGQRKQLDLVSTRWFDTRLDTTEVVPDPKQALTVFELVLPTGSCPYLYAWDGTGHRFVTDLLGAAPIGLPVAAGRYIEADPEEWVWVGNQQNFPLRDGRYQIKVTEELREILYLDYVRLVAVDHPPGTEIISTSKLVPGRPFPSHRLMQVGGRIPLRRAEVAGAGTVPRDVTADLAENDNRKVSPLILREPQYRGLAEPYSVTLDFGPLPRTGPLMLALSGWLRFGGGMANVAGSHNPEFPFPFPVLEVETSRGWEKVDVTVGAPAGKTKTILVDLAGHLPKDGQRLRLTQSFEIHWDRAALFTQATEVTGQTQPLVDANLRWRGYSEFADRPWTDPLTPVYDRIKSTPPWSLTPSGWATQYGPVSPLLAEADQGLAVIAGGDELSLSFAAASPPLTQGMERDFFLYTIGWDKDADYHVAQGTKIAPLPWRGMDDQRHGIEPRPAFPSDTLHERFNTRWVGERTYSRKQ